MLLGDILNRKKDTRSKDIEQEKSEYYQIADRLAAIVPEDYDIDEVADYVWLPEGTASASKQKAIEDAKKLFKEKENKKNSFLKKSAKKAVDAGAVLGFLALIKDALFKLDGDIFVLVFLVITTVAGLIFFDLSIHDN